MATPFFYSTTYILDKSHYIETYDASKLAGNAKRVCIVTVLLAILGFLLLLFTPISPYAAWFIIALGALEAFSYRFRKPWWLGRQLISKAANTELTLTINEDGLSSRSVHVKSEISWQEVNKIEQTAQGWLLYHAKGKTYLSGRCLSEAANEFIRAQA